MNFLKRAMIIALTGGLMLSTACSGSDSSSSSEPNSNSSETTTTPKAETTSAPETTTTPTTTTRKDPSEYGKVIALSFDDGPNSSTTMDVLDVLEENDIVASFFLIGNNITDATAPSVKRAFDMGCEINSHSLTHSYMTTLKNEEIIAEIDETASRIVNITGVEPKFFRPPYISASQRMYDIIDMPFIAGFGCNDWDAKVTVEQRVEKTLEQARDGAIILLHDAEGNFQTVEAIKQIIPALKEQGYEFVTVSDLFYAKGIEDPEAQDIAYNYAEQTYFG